MSYSVLSITLAAGPVPEDVWDATPTLTLGFVSVVVVIVSLVIFWKKKYDVHRRTEIL